jgi:trans-aconitate methyltransferase
MTLTECQPSEYKETDGQAAMDHEILKAARGQTRPLTIAQAIRPFYAHWAQSYYAFLAYWLSRGYQIKPMRDFVPDQERVLYLRHDIHWVDIPGALCMMDMERDLGISSTYCITWKYRNWDRDHAEDYLLLRKFGEDDFEYGLHECVLDEHIFDTYLDGGNDPEETKAVASRIIKDSGLTAMDPAFFFVRDPQAPHRFIWPEPKNIENQELRNWLQDAQDILKDRIADFRQAFVSCETTHMHGGYSISAMRQAFGFPSDCSYFDTDVDMSKPSWFFLPASTSLFPQSTMHECGVSAALERIWSTQCQCKGPVEIRDSKKYNTRRLANRMETCLTSTTQCFCLLHPSLWTTAHYNDLIDEVDDSTTSTDPSNKSLYAYAQYRMKLHQIAVPFFLHKYGENWAKNPQYALRYRYGIANFKDRAERVVSLLKQYNLEDIVSQGRIIDLGGGTGTIAAYLAGHYELEHIHVMDIDPPSLSMHDEVMASLGWQDRSTSEASTFTAWQAPEDNVDMVLSYGAFEYFYKTKDITSIFTQVGKALKPGGVFVANVWNHHYKNQGYSRAPYVQHLPTQPLRLFVARLMGKQPNPYFRSLSHRRWQRELRRAGMTDIKILYCRNTNDGFKFVDVQDLGRRKITHIWVLARKT